MDDELLDRLLVELVLVLELELGDDELEDEELLLGDELLLEDLLLVEELELDDEAELSVLLLLLDKELPLELLLLDDSSSVVSPPANVSWA